MKRMRCYMHCVCHLSGICISINWVEIVATQQNPRLFSKRSVRFLVLYRTFNSCCLALHSSFTSKTLLSMLIFFSFFFDCIVRRCNNNYTKHEHKQIGSHFCTLSQTKWNVYVFYLGVFFKQIFHILIIGEIAVQLCGKVCINLSNLLPTQGMIA